MDTPNKDGKSMPMFTPKNSDGSQRVIKQIMVIDPNKLRVAGLDLKMAEALKKSKGSRGNTHLNRTKDDKLALAKTLLNRKLKQAKSSKDAQNQNVTRDACDSPQKLLPSVAALQSLLSQPRTFCTPSPKKPHTMLVNILENDLRTGSIELTISNKPHVQQEKPAVEPIPKASIKMTKPTKAKDVPAKTIESMVISPAVKFEMKRKLLPLSSKRTPSDAQSNLAQVIESKVLSPEEKIDMKTLCGSSTKPMPAKVKIEITKQEILHRMPPGHADERRSPGSVIVPVIIKQDLLHKMPSQVNAVDAKEKPEERVTAPKQAILQKMPALVIAASAKEKPQECVIAPEQEIVPRLPSAHVYAVVARAKPNEGVVVPELKVSGDQCLHSSPPSEVPLTAEKEESAVDFINSLKMSATTKQAKSTTAPKVEPSAVQEDATSFLMALFGQQSFTPTLPPEVPKIVAVAVEEPVKADEPIIEKNATTPGNRRNRKTVPIIKQRPRVSGAAKVAKVVTSDALPASAPPVDKDVPESSAKVTSLKAASDELPAAGAKVDCSQEKSASTSNVPEQVDMTDSGERRTKESLALEMKSASLSSAREVRRSVGESTPKSREVPKLEEVQRSKLVDEESVKGTISAEVEQSVVEDDLVRLGVDDKLGRAHLDEDSVSKAAAATDSVPLEVVQTKVVDPVAPEEVGQAQVVKPSDVEEKSAKTVVTEKLAISPTVEIVDEAVVGEVKCDDSKIHQAHHSPIGSNVVPSGVSAECPQPETAQQTPVQVESKKIDQSTESIQPKVETVPSAPSTSSTPQPTARRKSKKSVPILIAKLSRSRKPTSAQEKPKEKEAQAAPTADKSLSTRDVDERVEAKNDVGDAAATSQSLSRGEEPTKTMEEVHPNKAEEVEKSSDPTAKEEQAVSSLPAPQGVIAKEPPSSQSEPVTKPAMGTEETEARTKPICSEDILTSSQSETPRSESTLLEGREEAEDDAAKIDPQVAPKETSVASTVEMGQEPRKETLIESPTEPTEQPQPSQNEEKQLPSPNELREEPPSATAANEFPSPEKPKPDEYQKEDKTAADVTEETTCALEDEISNSVLWTEAKTRRYSRVRKKSPVPRDHMAPAPEVAAKSVEAVPDIESPKMESPISQEALTSKESECHQQEREKEAISAPEVQAVTCDNNETISLPTAGVTEDDDESSDELVIDEDYHCDSDFMESFQDDADIGVTSHVEKPPPPEPAADFESLKSAEKGELDKSVYESKEDLDFLGFNEKEIEEGHQSTSLRLSQSEDISPLKSLPHAEKPTKKKGALQFKKIPLSVAKKQKAEQKNWKKNSAKTLQNWLKSSDKEAGVKEDGCSAVEAKETPAKGKELEGEPSPKEGKEIGLPDLDHAEITQASTPIGGRKKKGKQVESVPEKKTKPRKSSSKRSSKAGDEALEESATITEHILAAGSLKTEKGGEEVKESATNILEPQRLKTDKGAEEVRESLTITQHILEAHRESQSNTPASACAVESKTRSTSAARGRKKKSKRAEEGACASGSNAKEPKSSSKSKKNTTLDGHLVKLENEPTEIKGQSKACAIEVATDPLPTPSAEPCSNTAKRKLEMDCEELSKTPTSAAPPKKRKYTRKSLGTPTAAETTKTPKSSRSAKAKGKSKQLDVDTDSPQSVKDEHRVTPSRSEPNARKRKAPKCDADSPNKVAHISADTGHEFSTPTPKQRGPTKLESATPLSDTSAIAVTPQSERKYKNSTEFNPRLLLIRAKEEYKSDAPLVDPTLQMVPKSKDDVQCALCMGYTPKKKWLQHISEHYGVGWLAGEKPPLNITCRSAVLNYMVEFFKTSKVKGLNCRMCNVLRRSALGLLSHIEQCCLTEEEVKDSRVTCDHCKRDYSKSSMPSHLRSCSEIWKKTKPEPAPAEEVDEKEVVLSNTGRLKRKSVIKAEHKFKDMDSAEVSPDEFIKHIPQPRRDYCVAAWQRDIKLFGKGFCTEKRCEFTADTVEELQKHCQDGVCPHFVQPGYFCMKCKYRADNVEATRKHVRERHITKASEDFQASEDDAVISQGSSSEDGSSGDEEASEKSTVAVELDASAKRKLKRKSRAKPPSALKRNLPIKDIRKLVPLPTNNVSAEVARLHQDFINHNYSGSALFSYAAPNATQIADEDTEPYFSKSPLSPKFALNGLREPFVNALGTSRVQPDQWQQLQRLNGMGAETEHVTYLGGPVKAIAWAPLLPHTSSEFQYLASVTRKDGNKFSRFLQPKQSRSLVCIHRYQLTGAGTKQISGEIHYALAVEDGPIHCIEFLPSGGYDPELNRLGLLAVGTVRSEIKVYSLPLHVQKRDCDMFPIVRIEPSFVLGLELDERDPADHYTSQCSSLSWSQFAGHIHIVGGYINGFVSIWDISDDDENINRFLVKGVRKFVPISYFWSKENRIRDVTIHYDMNGLRWLGVCNTPRKLVFYDLRDISKPVQIMDEKAKNDCNAIDWPVVWANPAFALGDAMATHGSCLNTISPTALGYVTKKFERFCCGVTDLHFNPWTNMYAAGSENGDLQVTPLRDTVMDVSCRRKKEEKILSSLDIVPLNGEEINDSMAQASHVFETDYTEKYGIVFGPIRELTALKIPELYSPKRVPPLVLSRLSRIHRVRFNTNQRKNTFLAVGYVNGLLRILTDKWKDPVYVVK